MRLQPLPDELGPRFRTDRARAAGVAEGRLRAGDLDRPFHGVRRVSGSLEVAPVDRFGRVRGRGEIEHLERMLDYATRMRDEFFSHTSAAVAYGVPMPPGLLTRPIDVAVRPPSRLPRARGVRGHEVQPKHARVTADPGTGLILTEPAETWAMLGAVLRDIRDLVAAGDAFVRAWRVEEPLATLADLERAVAHGRRVGAPRLRDALPQVRTASASRPETWCRLVLTEAGLPEPLCNIEVHERGEYLGCVDLAYTHLRIAIEYEGEHHLLDPEQWARDIVRYDRLRDAGWVVIRVTKTDLFTNPTALAARVRRALAARS